MCKTLKFAFFLIIIFCWQEGQSNNGPKNQYFRADSIAALYAGHSILDLRSLSEKLTATLTTEREKFRAIYSWVCHNIRYDNGFYLKNTRMRKKLEDNPEALREWNRKSHPKVIKAMIRQGKTVCTGYAYLVKELAYFANIECKIIDGYGRSVGSNIGGEGFVNHSWNAVKLEGKWYLCDPTWSSGFINSQKGEFIKDFFEGYYLTPPELFVLNHFPLDTSFLLLNEKPTLDEFLNRPLVYREAFSKKIIPQSPSTFNMNVRKGEKITIRFKALEEFEEKSVELRVNRNSSEDSLFPNLYRDDEGNYCIDHTFVHIGTFDVHLLLDKEYIFTCTVRVKK